MRKQNVVPFDRSQALSEAAQRAYDEYLGKIENADPGYLLGVLAPMVHADQILPDSMRKTVYKLIAKQTGATVGSLESDRAKLYQTGETDDHLAAARDVIDSIGKQNLISCDAGLFVWSDDDGIWHRMSDRRLKTQIHRVIGGKLNKTVVTSIADLLLTECWREGFQFCEPTTGFINVNNGRLVPDGDTWRLEPHRRDDYMAVKLPVDFDPEAKAERFAQFLVEVFEGASDAPHRIRLVQQAMGYTLLPSCHLEKFFLLVGSGANGKSVLMSTMAALVGEDQTAAIQPSLFSNQFSRAHLEHKLLNLVTELSVGSSICDAQLKSLVSGEVIGCEQKFKDPRSFKPIATHWFGSNHLPSTRDFSSALFRRAALIEFPNEFYGDRRDPNLTRHLMSELPGILNMALAGLRDVLENGFVEPESMTAAIHAWRIELDQVHQWVDECCEPDPDQSEQTSHLYAEFSSWARHAGVQRQVGRKTFTQRLEKLGYRSFRDARTRKIGGLKIVERQPV